MDELLERLIFKAVDQTITPAEFDQLQDAIESNAEVRDTYLRAVSLCHSLDDHASEGRSESGGEAAGSQEQLFAPKPAVSRNGLFDLKIRFAHSLGVAAVLLLMVGTAAFWFGRQSDQSAALTTPAGADLGGPDLQVSGHATLRRSFDLDWADSGSGFRDGDVLPNGRLRFVNGVAEIDFFCGATVIVEGPAELDIQSDWLVEVVRGRLRASVPPAARGFVIRVADSDIVDLGTEFAIEVNTDHARVEVIDGEVEIRGGDFDGNLLRTGQQRWLKGERDSGAIVGISTASELERRRAEAAESRYATWRLAAQDLRDDERLIAFYPMADLDPGPESDGRELDASGTDRLGPRSRRIRNAAASGESRDGKIVGPVERVHGRFGAVSSGLNFAKIGSRVRTRIDGDFEAFTFACWVRIDRLEHAYNALFMSDGYETGELHWQIRKDGCLMFSVMVDDTKRFRHFSPVEQREVEAAGLARVYHSGPVWNPSMRGQWLHLAAVYDPAARTVDQYVDGKRVASEPILDKFHIEKVRIGPAEIGNWGQPFRKSPVFAVRNLHGAIDSMAIFKAALGAEEINDLYEVGKPVGY